VSGGIELSFPRSTGPVVHVICKRSLRASCF